MTEMETRWVRGDAFAEVAEALDMQPTDIMAAMPQDFEEGIPGFFVLYTVNTQSPDAEIWRVWLLRDAEGVLRVQGSPKVVGNLAELHGRIDKMLDEME